MLKKTGRVLAFIVAILFILFSIGGIVGAWWLNSAASDVTLKVFSAVETGVGVIDAGVARVNALVETSRTEVQQAEETINTVAGNLQANNPVLAALSERLETRLGPTVDNIQEAIAPVRDALLAVSNVVSIANSIPFIQERAPGIEKVDATFNRLGDIAADTRQLRGTLQAAAAGRADQITAEAATTLTTLTTRIDTRLAEARNGRAGDPGRDRCPASALAGLEIPAVADLRSGSDSRHAGVPLGNLQPGSRHPPSCQAFPHTGRTGRHFVIADRSRDCATGGYP